VTTEIFSAKARAMWTETSLRTRDIFIVKTDTKYLMGMLNNPGKTPNATINK